MLSRQRGGLLANPMVRGVLSYLANESPTQEPLLDQVLVTYEKHSEWRFLLWYLLIDLIRRRLGVSRETLVNDFIDNAPVRSILVNACRSLARYGPTQPQVFSSPLLVVWNFTNQCNLECKHCYQDASRAMADELSLSERRRVVDELVANDVPMLSFSGGEPLISADFWEVADYANRQGIHVSVATNGTLISPEVARRLKQIGVEYVQISVDSAQPEKHDLFRGVSGYWQKAIEGARNAVGAGLRVGIAPTMTSRNVDELGDLIALAKELGARNFCAFNFIPTGRGARIAQDDLSPEQRERTLQVLYEGMLGGEMVTMSTCPQLGRFCFEKNPEGPMAVSHFTVGAAQQAKLLAEYVGGCGCGRVYCAIQPNGVVTPCVFMPVPVGDLRQQSLAEIWELSSVLQELRNREDLEPHCGVCSYRTVCGGCRARAYAYFGDYKAPDPGCRFNASLWQELKAKDEPLAAIRRA